jgi:hypothetical protein
MDVEDHEFLSQMVADGSNIRSKSDPVTDNRLAQLEATISKLANALEVSQAAAKNGRIVNPAAGDPYGADSGLGPEPVAPYASIADEELRVLLEDSDLSDGDLPEQISLEQSIAQAEAAEIEEQREAKRKARSAKKVPVKKVQEKAKEKKPETKGVESVRGATPKARAKRGVPKLR